MDYVHEQFINSSKTIFELQTKVQIGPIDTWKQQFSVNLIYSGSLHRDSKILYFEDPGDCPNSWPGRPWIHLQSDSWDRDDTS